MTDIAHTGDRVRMPAAEEEFYGQFGEDFLLWRFFENRPTGFFLEVGAFDGVFLSPTYWFERHGWSGICVEPHPDYFPLCRKNRPGSACVHAACVGSDSVKTIELFAEPSGLFSVLGAANEELMRQRFVDAWGKNLQGVHPVEVPACTIDELLRQYLPAGRTLDFVSIDVEGVEIEVLQGFDLERHGPRVLIIETNTESDREKVASHLARFGYREARRLYVNTLYVRNEEDAQRLQSIMLEYRTARRLHPAGASFTPPAQNFGEYRSERRVLLQQSISESRELRAEIEMLRAAVSSLRSQVDEKEQEIRSLKSVADERLVHMLEKEKVIQDLGTQQSQRRESMLGRVIGFLRGLAR